MSRPGRTREPVSLILLKGNKAHKTKAEIEQRKAEEIKPDADNVKPPKYLPKELRKDFNKIAKELAKVELISNLDTDTLARFLISREQYIRTMEEMRKLDSDDIFGLDKLSKINDTFFKQCRAGASDLGLSINARCRLLVPKAKDDNKEPSPFQQRFGGV